MQENVKKFKKSVKTFEKVQEKSFFCNYLRALFADLRAGLLGVDSDGKLAVRRSMLGVGEC